MDKEQSFWYSVWRLVAISFCVMVISIAGCVANNNRLIADMVKEGENPIVAGCAFGVSGSYDAMICASITNRK